MPTPAAAGMIAAVVHAVKFPLDDWRQALLWLALLGSLAALMASHMRYYSFKDIDWYRRQPSLVVVLIALLVMGIWLYSEEVFLILASGYSLSGVTWQLARAVRHRLVSRPA